MVLGHDKLAARCLADGVIAQRRIILARCGPYGMPPSFRRWLKKNVEQLQHAATWETMLRSNDRHDRDQTLVRVITLVFLSGLGKEAAHQLERVTSPPVDDWRKMLAMRVGSIPGRQLEPMTEDQVFGGSYDDIAAKIHFNILARVFGRATQGGLLTAPERDWLSANCSSSQALSPRFELIGRVLNRIASGKIAEASALLEGSGISPDLAVLDARTGPHGIFIGGFGWTGSSAVFDALRGYPEAQEMPGTGDQPFLNAGADSEPMLHQGPAGIHQLSEELRTKGRVEARTWSTFLRLYVLSGDHQNYAEYKTTKANERLRELLGSEMYESLILSMLSEYCAAVASQTTEQSDGPFGRFGDRIVKSLFKDDAVVLFNNSVNPYKIDALGSVGFPNTYLAVERSIVDQFADQKLSNSFLQRGAFSFCMIKFWRIFRFRRGIAQLRQRKSLTRVGILHFEEWVRNQSLRSDVATQTFGYYDAAHERKFFNPERSVRNIGLGPSLLCWGEFAYLKLSAPLVAAYFRCRSYGRR